MKDVVFDDLRWLHLLWLVALVALLGVFAVWQRRRALRLFASTALLPLLAPRVGWLRGLTRVGLISLALSSLVVAICGPRWGERQERVYRRGVDVMVVMDVSRSMLARDLAPNRLERAKLALSDDLLPALGGDRIGLIAFAGVPSLKCPLTTDYGFFRLALDDLGPQSSPRGGTLIGDALKKAGDSFDNLDTHKIILLITDGEDHDSYPVEAARTLWQTRKIPIVAVALGDEREGARIPVETGRNERYLEYQGQTVWSRSDFRQLREIVAAAGRPDFFVPVGTRDFDLGDIYRRKIAPTVRAQEQLESERVPLPSQYHPFAVAALLLVLIESLIPDRTRVAAVGARRPVAREAA